MGPVDAVKGGAASAVAADEVVVQLKQPVPGAYIVRPGEGEGEEETEEVWVQQQ